MKKLALWTIIFSMMIVLAIAQTINLGEINILSTGDSGNGNLLLAQKASLGQTSTIQSISFYVINPSGKLRLGIYDASGPNGIPGLKKAETNEITPVAGWNTANVTIQTLLDAGIYWLAYLPSSNSLSFRVDNTSGTSRYYSYSYNIMPSTFSSSPNVCNCHWSLYATLNPVSPPPPIPPPATNIPAPSNTEISKI